MTLAGSEDSATNGDGKAAGHDLTVDGISHPQTNEHDSRTNLDRVATLYVTGTSGVVQQSEGIEKTVPVYKDWAFREF